MSRLNGVEEIDDFSLKTGDCWDEYVPTGFPKLDAAMGGGLNIGLNILGALSALGKTTLMEQIATNISNMGREVLFVTLEMRKKQIAAKAISRQSYLQGGKDAAFTSAELKKKSIIEYLEPDREQLYQNSCSAVRKQWRNFSLISNQDKLWTVSRRVALKAFCLDRWKASAIASKKKIQTMRKWPELMASLLNAWKSSALYFSGALFLL